MSLGVRFVLATLFLAAGAPKLAQREAFESAVRNYELTPAAWSPVIAVALPALEVACGVLLAVGILVRPVAALLAAMLVLFAAAVAVNLARGRHIDCGCFGVATPTEITWFTVARNVILALAGISVAFDAGETSVSTGDTVAVAVFATAAVTAVAIATAAWKLRASAIRFRRTSESVA